MNLSGKIPDDVLTTLKKVSDVAERIGLPIFVVGATARDIVLEHNYGIRPPIATGDMDFGVAVENWGSFEQLRKELLEDSLFVSTNNHFRIKNESAGIPVDLLPFGGVEDPPGRLTLGDGERPLTTTGFTKAFECSIQVQNDDGFTFKVASIPGLVLLKLMAFYDRPSERDRDIQDIWFILKKFFDIGNEDRLYDEHADLLDDPDFDLDHAAARLLGRDVAQLLTEETRTIVLDTLSEQSPKEGLNRMITVVQKMENRLDDTSDQIKSSLRYFKLGITDDRRRLN